MWESWEKIYCRGTWDNLKFNGEVLTFNTETAWSPCNEMFDMVCEKYPTLRYFYQSEEPGMCEYWTNDDEGKDFPGRYYVDVTRLGKRIKEERLCLNLTQEKLSEAMMTLIMSTILQEPGSWNVT